METMHDRNESVQRWFMVTSTAAEEQQQQHQQPIAKIMTDMIDSDMLKKLFPHLELTKPTERRLKPSLSSGFNADPPEKF